MDQAILNIYDIFDFIKNGYKESMVWNFGFLWIEKEIIIL